MNDAELDALLRQDAQGLDAEAADFATRLMPSLPSQAPARRAPSRPVALQTPALAAVGLGLGALWLESMPLLGGLPALDLSLATLLMLGLLVWWSVPQSPGSAWH
ncbi:hypothetical protein HNQ51_003006 [Inhella inkyongensis]|uniref:Uncharacterized protein n=1 Tax=Inhella inkyongensis TaxID=392593 RepID=A0A840SBF2_9BURK|nr:hypothetical protein [Inhella inkyongensis]MBB5205679.1 hypothetical protein [Inhella inkyongensis]